MFGRSFGVYTLTCPELLELSYRCFLEVFAEILSILRPPNPG